MTGARQIPGAGHADHAAAENQDFHKWQDIAAPGVRAARKNRNAVRITCSGGGMRRLVGRDRGCAKQNSSNALLYLLERLRYSGVGHPTDRRHHARTRT
jgi:hypothetical protein